MCTCLSFKKIDHYFGRTLDLDFHYNEEAVITPRGYSFCLKNGEEIKSRYAFIGTAIVINEYPLYYEAVNEEGLGIAGLNFPYSAQYKSPEAGKLNLTPYELIPYFLSKYSSINEMLNDLKKLNITNISFMDDMPLSPLHFMVSDKKGSIVLEQTREGLSLYENYIGVMTNNPSFDIQLKEIENYSYLSPKFKEPEDLRYYCVGLGAKGLPGDTSSQSRFVKAAFLRGTTVCGDTEEEAVGAFFHILDNVSMVKGSTRGKADTLDITFYTACINQDKGIYYYKTYNNSQISALRMTDENKNSSSLTRHVLITKEKINYIN